MDITQGPILQQANQTTIGAVTEEKGNALSRIAERFAVKKLQERVDDNAAMAALEGIQSAAMGKTISEIQAGTPLFDTVMNIDARVQQAKAYYANNVANEVANEVNLGLSKYKDLEPEKARDLIYKDYMTAINNRAGGDVNTFNAISASALQKVSQSYSIQGLDYIQGIQQRTDDEQAKSIAIASDELQKAAEGLKNTSDPTRTERFHNAVENWENVALPIPGQSHERFQQVLQKAALSMANKAGTTETIQNEDGTETKIFHGAQAINSFINTPLFTSLPAETQHHILSARSTAETRVIQSLPEEAILEQANLRNKAREAGASPEAIMRTGIALNNKWKNKLGLVNADIMTEAEIEQLGTSRFTANKAAVLESQWKAEQRQKEAQQAQDDQQKMAALDATINNRMNQPAIMQQVHATQKEISDQYNYYSAKQGGLHVNDEEKARKMLKFQASSKTMVPEIKTAFQAQADAAFSSNAQAEVFAHFALKNFEKARRELTPEQLVDLYGVEHVRRLEILEGKVNNGKVPLGVALPLVSKLEVATGEDAMKEAGDLLNAETQGNFMGALGVQTAHLPKNVGPYFTHLLNLEIAVGLQKIGRTASQTEKKAFVNKTLDSVKVYGSGSSFTSTPILVRGNTRDWEMATSNFTDGGRVKPMGADKMQEALVKVAREKTLALSKQTGRVFDNDMTVSYGVVQYAQNSDPNKPPIPYITLMSMNDEGENVTFNIFSQDVTKYHLQEVAEKERVVQEKKQKEADRLRAERAVREAKAVKRQEEQYYNQVQWEERKETLKQNSNSKQSLWNLKPAVDK